MFSQLLLLEVGHTGLSSAEDNTVVHTSNSAFMQVIIKRKKFVFIYWPIIQFFKIGLHWKIKRREMQKEN